MVSIQVLKEFKLFRGLDDSELAMISKICNERTLEKDTSVFVQGDSAKDLHLCYSGMVYLTVKLRKPWETEATVQVVKGGEVFGWSSMLQPNIYTSSARCAEKTEELYINAIDLIGLAEKNSHLGYILMKNLLVVVSSRLIEAINLLERRAKETA